MIHGAYKDVPDQEAKGLIKNRLCGSGDAFLYAESEGVVISRSRDTCVAPHLDQWYLNYGPLENGGDGEWYEQVREHIENDLNLYSAESKAQFQKTLAWLGQWACARSFGLGSKLPWNPNFLVESLSDSTVYTSYFTVAHLLHKDIYSKEPGLAGVRPDQMTDEVWDYVLPRSEDVNSDIDRNALDQMRREFEYWYPVDLRVSGKDLIQNHLTFFLYIHSALWPKEYWPRSIRPNGHLLLNGAKMSKSNGNFLTIDEAVRKFGADAVRLAIADAGDAVDDANLEEAVANKIIR